MQNTVKEIHTEGLIHDAIIEDIGNLPGFYLGQNFGGKRKSWSNNNIKQEL